MVGTDAKCLPAFFNAALTINLAERIDRRKSAEREFRQANWTGVKFVKACQFDDAAGFNFASWRGCFHSHLECFRFAQQNELENILILEDDIALSPSIQRFTPVIIETLHKLEWDLVYFGHEQTGDIPRATDMTTDLGFNRCAIEIQTTHFYAVNRRVLARLIAHFERLAAGAPGDKDFGPMPADAALNTFRRHNKDVKTYVANPKLGWQRPSRSDISPHPLDNINILRPFIAAARNLKHL